MKKRKINSLLMLMVIFSSIFYFISEVESSNSLPISVLAQEVNDEIEVEIFPKKVNYNQHAVMTIEVPDDFTITEAYINAETIGSSNKITVDLELLEYSLAIPSDAKIGLHELKVVLVDDKENTLTKTVELEVVQRPKDDDLDFDWDEAIIYFLLTDRFMDGDPSNNNPNDEDYDVNHPESYHGGDFQGIIDQLDYLDDLGINTIWITPIVDNVNHNHRHGKEGSQYGYHGYWAKDFTKIDEHIGDIETMKTLIDEAHERGIKIMVDVVINHTGYGLKMTDEGAAIQNFPTQEEQAVFDGMLRLNPLNGHEVLGELYGLPDFITEDESVRNQVIQWQTDWVERLRTEKGHTIDYFRVDTVKHVDDTTLSAFKNELTKIDPDFKLIGEHFGGTYNNTGGYLNSGQMDSLLDFDFKRIASAFMHGKIEQAEAELMKRNEAIDHTAMVGQFLSSHDEDGFLYYFAQGDEDLFKIAVSLQLTAKGQPVIYYGEEIGMSGPAEGNMDNLEFSGNREDFDWDKVEGHHLVDHYQRLLAIRQDYSEIFAKGDRNHLAGTDETGYSIFSRSYQEEVLYVGLNTLSEPIETSIEVQYPNGTVVKDMYNDILYEVDDKNQLTLQLPSNADGGTVILVLTDETLPEDRSDVVGIILVVGGTVLVSVGLYANWRARKKKQL